MQNKKAFSFVEIIITVSIIALLAVVGMSYQGASNQKAQNTRAIGDLETLNNSLASYLKDTKSLPEPQGNKNYYNSGSEYEHDTTNAFGVHGFATQNLLPKKYLNYLPLDPRTNQYYAYGKTIDNKFYEVAGVVNIDGKYTTKLMGNYPGENGPFSLIREYNGPNFISDNSRNSFPYNPEEKLLVAKINNVSGSVSITNIANIYVINDINQVKEHTLVEGDIITVPAGKSATIFFSDGSQSVLGDSSQESKLTLNDMQFKEDDNLLTRIKLSLESGTLWTKATRLNQDSNKSDFEVHTQDTTAAVRGTIFGVSYNGTTTKIQVIKGIVNINGDDEGEGENYNGKIGSIPNFPINIRIPKNTIPTINPEEENILDEYKRENPENICKIGQNPGTKKDGKCIKIIHFPTIGDKIKNLKLGNHFKIRFKTTLNLYNGSQYIFSLGDYKVLYNNNNNNIYYYYSYGKQANINTNITGITDIKYIQFEVNENETKLSLLKSNLTKIASNTGTLISNNNNTSLLVGRKDDNNNNHQWKNKIEELIITKYND